MSADETSETAETAKKRRGPRKESEIRAEVEQELRERLREELLAEMAEAKRDAEDATPISGAEVSGNPMAEGSITVHFVEDGLTLLGRVWYRGEELTVEPGSAQWNIAHKVLEMDEYAQEAKWGRRFFREGPWRGKRLDEIEDEVITEADREALRKAQEQRDKRMGALT